MNARPLRFQETVPTVQPANQRRHGRLRVIGVQCSLGEVLDIAPMGMRVRCRGGTPVPVGQHLTLTMTTPLGLLALEAEVLWIRKAGLRHSEVGLAFVNMTADVARGVTAVAQGCSVAT